jgi:flagellar basal-body rod modification protein FlgD
MATSAISETTQIGIQDFLRILVAQLNNQDPLKPLDNQEFVTQLAQFTSLQQTQEMNDKLSSLLSVQASTQSIGLLGRAVDVQTDTGSASGTVSALTFVAGEPRLTIRLANNAVLTDITLANLVTVR